MIARERSGTGNHDSDSSWFLVSLPNSQKHLRFPNPLMGHPILQGFIGGAEATIFQVGFLPLVFKGLLTGTLPFLSLPGSTIVCEI